MTLTSYAHCPSLVEKDTVILPKVLFRDNWTVVNSIYLGKFCFKNLNMAVTTCYSFHFSLSLNLFILMHQIFYRLFYPSLNVFKKKKMKASFAHLLYQIEKQVSLLLYFIYYLIILTVKSSFTSFMIVFF